MTTLVERLTERVVVVGKGGEGDVIVGFGLFATPSRSSSWVQLILLDCRRRSFLEVFANWTGSSVYCYLA
jgi:hypothetical protein